MKAIAKHYLKGKRCPLCHHKTNTTYKFTKCNSDNKEWGRFELCSQCFMAILKSTEWEIKGE